MSLQLQGHFCLEHSLSLLVLLGLISHLLGEVLVLGIIVSLEVSEHGSRWPHLDLVDQALVLHNVGLLLLLLQLGGDASLSLLQLLHVAHLTSGELAVEVEAELLNADLRLEDMVWQRSRELLNSLIRRESLWLNLVLVGLLVERKSMPSDGGINRRAKVGIIFDDISLSSFDLDVLSTLVHLSEDLNSLPLDLSESTLLILSLLESDLFSSLGVLLLSLLFSLNEGRLQKVESLIL